MEHIDTITATTIEVGDLVELWDDEADTYVTEEVQNVEDDDDFIIVTTDTFPDGLAVQPDALVRIFGY